MLKRVQLENFRCFRSVEVPLRPLTVLIGPNDTGKSAFLRALRILTTSRGKPERRDWRRGEAPAILTAFPTGGDPYRIGGRDNRLAPHADPSSCGLYLLPVQGVAMESPGHAETERPPTLKEDGSGVPAFLDHLGRIDHDRFEACVEAMRRLVPGFESIIIRHPKADTRRIDLVIEGGFGIEADRASAGVRLLLFFVALAYHPDPPKLILLEEPENGVHPKRLEQVMRLLKEVTQGRHGDHTAQIVLTTHSPHLLDWVELETDQVLIFRRTEDGSRTAEQADESRLKNFLDEFKLGEVWFNEDEAGLVGRDA